MTATGFLLLLIGVFVLLNASNFVRVVRGEAKVNWSGTGNPQVEATTEIDGIVPIPSPPSPESPTH